MDTDYMEGRASPNNYFEDFEVGQVIAHARGKTVTEMDNVLLTNLVMNTADGHFNEHRMQQQPALPDSIPALSMAGSASRW
jgi:itaconyl-CoA hydratase